MSQSVKPSRADRSLRRTSPWGIQVGKLDGMSTAELAAFLRRALLPRPGFPSKRNPFHVNYSGSFGGPRPAKPLTGWKPCGQDSYLVDSASSHMLVSKIKPCMSKYKQLYGETANGSLNQLSFI